jgi:hypothetical protein
VPDSTTSSARRYGSSRSSWRDSGGRPESRRRTPCGHRQADAADLLPSGCPYALDDLLIDGWYAVNRGGLPDDR